MTIFNRRNAVVGWAVVAMTRRSIRRKAKRAFAQKEAAARTAAGATNWTRQRARALAVLAAGAVGALTYVRARGRREGGEDQ